MHTAHTEPNEDFEQTKLLGGYDFNHVCVRARACLRVSERKREKGAEQQEAGGTCKGVVQQLLVDLSQSSRQPRVSMHATPDLFAYIVSHAIFVCIPPKLRDGIN
eukprot:6189335-Pleurochrysis_carterae.AAC.2